MTDAKIRSRHDEVRSGGAAAGVLTVDFRGALGRPLRVGGIDYLNSRPLLESFAEVAGEEVRVELQPPSELARRLRAGELDVALVPVVEYFLSPRRHEYSIVPGVSIASWGAVESIRLFHRRPLGAVRAVALDHTSMTSQLLTRLLFTARPSASWTSGRDDASAEESGAAPVFESIQQSRVVAALEGGTGVGGRLIDEIDAALLIGDSALAVAPAGEWRACDLGLEWTRWTGLPFVYALWIYQGAPPSGVADCFREVRRRGEARIDEIVDAGPLPAGMTRRAAMRYLSHVIRFRFGTAEAEGMLRFARELHAAGLIEPSPPELRYVDADGGA